MVQRFDVAASSCFMQSISYRGFGSISSFLTTGSAHCLILAVKVSNSMTLNGTKLHAEIVHLILSYPA